MLRRLLVLAAAVAVLGWAAAAVADATVEKGMKVYTEAKPACKMCHAIGGVGNAKGSLDDVGSKLKAEDIKAWLRTPKEMTEKAKATRKPPMPAYSPEKLPDADVEALTAYLLSLKK